MQYSSNSNAAIVGEIRSACTPVGQYRRAALIAADKEYTLKAYEIERQKQTFAIERLEIKARAAGNTAHSLRGQGGDVQRSAEIEAQEYHLEIDLLKLQMNQAEALVEDAARELYVAKTMMDQACVDAAIDFGKLPTSEFQELMREEYRDRQLRHQLAGIYAAQVGMPTDRLEALLEMPQEELLAIAAKLGPLMSQNPIQLLGAANGAI